MHNVTPTAPIHLFPEIVQISIEKESGVKIKQFNFNYVFLRIAPRCKYNANFWNMVQKNEKKFLKKYGKNS